MKSLGKIVCGGGWKSRRDARIEIWQMLIFLIMCVVALALGGTTGGWFLLGGAMLFLASFILLRWNRSRTWSGMLDNTVPTVPKQDLHKLH